MTGIVSHTSKRLGWHQKRHTYLVDIGEEIEIPQIETSDLYEDHLMNPPFPKTRYFEIEIDEIGGIREKIGSFRNIYPVLAHRKPDWHILRFRIRRGSWTITKRIQYPTPSGASQWIYTDDFNLIFLASGGRYNAATLIQIIVTKLDAIAQSIRSGSRIPSEFENKESCRTVLDTMFAGGVDNAFRDTVLYQHHVTDFPGGSVNGSGPMPTREGISSHHGKATLANGKVPATGIHVDLDEIEELRDLSWLED